MGRYESEKLKRQVGISVSRILVEHALELLLFRAWLGTISIRHNRLKDLTAANSYQ